jgi:hypothetical protein
MVHTDTTLSQTSITLILALASIFGFDVWTTDICQAYLQSAERLKMAIFMKTDAVELGRGEFCNWFYRFMGFLSRETTCLKHSQIIT